MIISTKGRRLSDSHDSTDFCMSFDVSDVFRSSRMDVHLFENIYRGIF